MGAQDKGPKKDEPSVPETRDAELAVAPQLPPSEPEAVGVAGNIGSIRTATGSKAVCMDPLVDKVDWGTQDRLSEDELKQRVDEEFAKIGSTSKITPRGIAYILATTSKAEAMLGKRIVVVDDSKDILQGTIPLLTIATNGQAKYILHKGEDVETVCRAIIEANPEFVLMDYSLAGELTGDTVIKRLRQLRPDIKCVGFSSESNRGTEFSKAGAIGSIKKDPYDAEGTLKGIISMIGS